MERPCQSETYLIIYFRPGAGGCAAQIYNWAVLVHHIVTSGEKGTHSGVFSSIQLSGNLNQMEGAMQIWLLQRTSSDCFVFTMNTKTGQVERSLRSRDWLEIDLLVILSLYFCLSNYVWYAHKLREALYLFLSDFLNHLLNFWVLNNRTGSSVENFQSDGMSWLHHPDLMILNRKGIISFEQNFFIPCFI